MNREFLGRSCVGCVSGLVVALQPRASHELHFPQGMSPRLWDPPGWGQGCFPVAKGDLNSVLFVSSVRELIIQKAW